MKNTRVNLEIIERIARGLGDLNDKVIYVGGAIVSMYINDPAAEDIRPTKDIDISVSLASLGELEALRLELTEKGFVQSVEDDVVCRFRYEDILVDVMNTRELGWAPANPWFGPGFKAREIVQIGNTSIQIMPLPYFLASKFAAFQSRGAIDPRTSQDFEDIVYILDNQMNIVDEIRTSPKNVKPFLIKEFNMMIENPLCREAIQAHLYYDSRIVRFKRIEEAIQMILA